MRRSVASWEFLLFLSSVYFCIRHYGPYFTHFVVSFSKTLVNIKRLWGMHTCVLRVCVYLCVCMHVAVCLLVRDWYWITFTISVYCSFWFRFPIHPVNRLNWPMSIRDWYLSQRTSAIITDRSYWTWMFSHGYEGLSHLSNQL